MQSIAALPDLPVRKWRQNRDGTWVNRSCIIGMDIVTYHAYVEMTNNRSHSTITHVDPARGGIESVFPRAMWLGQLGTEKLPPELDALPAFSEERSQRVSRFQELNRSVARGAITVAFPEARAAYGEGWPAADHSSMELHVPGAAHLARIENHRLVMASNPDWPMRHSCESCGTSMIAPGVPESSWCGTCVDCQELIATGTMPPEGSATLTM